jgi:glutathione synthase/RimK-type ligase-like ATP-grasp enzyme
VKVAVHWQCESFADRWLESLCERGIAHDRISAYDTDIMVKIQPYDVLLWNWTLHDPVALTHARSILAAIAHTGTAVYPDLATCWHYDDKIAQKYLLESVGAPLVRTHVFFDEEAACAWLDQAEFPVVFKLRRGAGSYNVRLIRNARAGRHVVARMFGRGEVAVPGYFGDAATKLRQIHAFTDVTARLGRLPAALRAIAREQRLVPRESGYALFQEFQPANEFDTRVVVVGNRAFGLRRRNRPGDFRASGSGLLDYDARAIAPEAVSIAFDVSRKLGFQSMAYDFLLDRHGRPAICEISYCFAPGQVYHRCEGHWDPALNFHPGHTYIEDAILDFVLHDADPDRGGRDAPRV